MRESVLRGVSLLCGAIALHPNPLAVVQGLTRGGLPGGLLQPRSTAAAVGSGADGDLGDPGGKGGGG